MSLLVSIKRYDSGTATGLDLHLIVEDQIAVFGGNTDTGIQHGETQTLAQTVMDDIGIDDDTTTGGELEGITEQLTQDGRDGHRVEVELARYGRLHMARNNDAAFRQSRCGLKDCLVQQRHQLHHPTVEQCRDSRRFHGWWRGWHLGNGFLPTVVFLEFGLRLIEHIGDHGTHAVNTGSGFQIGFRRLGREQFCLGGLKIIITALAQNELLDREGRGAVP